MNEMFIGKLLAQWVNPAGVACVVAGVVWLIRLQGRVERSEHTLTRHERTIENLDSTQDKILQSLGRIEGKINQ